MERTRGGDVDRIGGGTEVLLDSTLPVRFELRPSDGVVLKFPPFLEELVAFAFKVMDLRATGGRFAAFLLTFDFGFTFVAMRLRNCMWIPLKSQGVRPALYGTAVAGFGLLLGLGHANCSWQSLKWRNGCLYFNGLHVITGNRRVFQPRLNRNMFGSFDSKSNPVSTHF
jgi:hypothetical protein